MHARDEQIHSLVDGRARWPDGRIREIGVPLFERMQQRASAIRAEIHAERADAAPVYLR